MLPQSRANGIEKLHKALVEVRSGSALLPQLPQFVEFLMSLVRDSNFKIALSSLQILSELITKVGRDMDAHVRWVLVANMVTQACAPMHACVRKLIYGMHGHACMCAGTHAHVHAHSACWAHSHVHASCMHAFGHAADLTATTCPDRVIVPTLIDKFSDSKVRDWNMGGGYLCCMRCVARVCGGCSTFGIGGCSGHPVLCPYVSKQGLYLTIPYQSMQAQACLMQKRGSRLSRGTPP